MLLFLVLLTCLLSYLRGKRWWMCFVPYAKIKSSQVIKSNSFHYLSQPLNDFAITHQFYIENIYNATVSSLVDLLALLFVREEISSECEFGSKFKSQLILLFILFYYSAYFYYYLWVLLHFLILFIGLTILFQLTFPFMYSTFNKKFSVSAK